MGKFERLDTNSPLCISQAEHFKEKRGHQELVGAVAQAEWWDAYTSLLHSETSPTLGYLRESKEGGA